MADKLQEPELVYDAKATLGEGPVWDHRTGCLYWVDILENQLHRFDPNHPDTSTRVSIKPYVSSIVPRQSGGIALTLQDGFYAFDLESRQLSLLAEVEATITDNRFNDGKCDPAGRFVAGTMSMSDQPARGALYTLDADHAVKRLLSDVHLSNGLAWTEDGKTLYHIDTPTRQVKAYDYNLQSGEIQNGRVVVQFPDDQGFPDGMTIDAEGMLWIAHWGGWQVSRWNPATGSKLGYVAVPASQVTCCTFGGPNLDQLYITTARIGLDEQALEHQPAAGGLFRVSLGIKGLQTSFYRG